MSLRWCGPRTGPLGSSLSNSAAFAASNTKRLLCRLRRHSLARLTGEFHAIVALRRKGPALDGPDLFCAARRTPAGTRRRSSRRHLPVAALNAPRGHACPKGAGTSRPPGAGSHCDRGRLAEGRHSTTAGQAPGTIRRRVGGSRGSTPGELSGHSLSIQRVTAGRGLSDGVAPVGACRASRS